MNKEIVPIAVSVYVAENGGVPLENWLKGLHRRARARLLARIARVRAGNLGDWSLLTNASGVCELREFFGPGYRIYYGREADQELILLYGSDKSGQKKAIKQAEIYWVEYQRR